MKKLQTTFFTAFIVTASTAYAGKWLSLGENLTVNLDQYGFIQPTLMIDYGAVDCKPTVIKINPAIQFDKDKVAIKAGVCAKSDSDQAARSEAYKIALESFEDIREFLDDDDTFYQLK